MRPSLLTLLVACATATLAAAPQSAMARRPVVVRGTSASGDSGPLRLSNKMTNAMKRFGFRFLQEGQQAMDFTLSDVSGSDYQLMGHQGTWVLLNFFATWCGPCMREMPALQTLSRAGACLQVVGVATGRSENPAGIAAQLGIGFPILWDRDDAVGSTWGVHQFPTTYLVDPRGFVHAMAVGGRSWELMASAVSALPGCDRRLRR